MHTPSVQHSNGPVSHLKLDALILPMTPDLALSLADSFVVQMANEAKRLGEDLLLLPDSYANLFKSQYGIRTKGGLPFQIPPGSAHLIVGHKGAMARHLIYACPFDANENGPCFDQQLLELTISNAFAVARDQRARVIGLPNLVSPIYRSDYSVDRSMDAITSIATSYVQSTTEIDTLHILSFPKNHPMRVQPPVVLLDPQLN